MARIVIALIFVLTIFISPVRAEHDTDMSVATSSAIEVDKIASIFDRVGEKIHGFFKFSNEDKLSYQRDLIEKRFAELVYVVDDGQGDMVEEVSSRYSTYVGKFSEDLISRGVKSENVKYLEMYERHLKILPKLRDHFPANSGLWLLVQHDINTVQMFIDRIKSS